MMLTKKIHNEDIEKLIQNENWFVNNTFFKVKFLHLCKEETLFNDFFFKRASELVFNYSNIDPADWNTDKESCLRFISNKINNTISTYFEKCDGVKTESEIKDIQKKLSDFFSTHPLCEKLTPTLSFGEKDIYSTPLDGDISPLNPVIQQSIIIKFVFQSIENANLFYNTYGQEKDGLLNIDSSILKVISHKDIALPSSLYELECVVYSNREYLYLTEKNL